MSTKTREVIWGGRIMGAKTRAEAARQEARKADRAEAEAWSVRMEGYGGPAQPKPNYRPMPERRLWLAGDRVLPMQGHGRDAMQWDDDDLTFTATLGVLEASLVTVPADAGAGIRAYPGDVGRALVIADLSERVQVLMLARTRIATRQRVFNAQQALSG